MRFVNSRRKIDKISNKITSNKNVIDKLKSDNFFQFPNNVFSKSTEYETDWIEIQSPPPDSYTAYDEYTTLEFNLGPLELEDVAYVKVLPIFKTTDGLVEKFTGEVYPYYENSINFFHCFENYGSNIILRIRMAAFFGTLDYSGGEGRPTYNYLPLFYKIKISLNKPSRFLQ